jgi:hypothetical protein
VAFSKVNLPIRARHCGAYLASYEYRNAQVITDNTANLRQRGEQNETNKRRKKRTWNNFSGN